MVSVRPVRLLGGLAAFLVVAHLAGLVAQEWFGMSRESGLPRQFDLNAEANLAAWFYSFLLLCSAVVALGLMLTSRVQHERLTGRWAALSALLLLMAVDETAQLHDMATGPLRRGLDLDFGALYFAWLIPALVVLATAGIYFVPLVRSLSSPTRHRLVAAAAVYLGGAVGVEMIGGFVVQNGRQSFSYLALTTVEELGELAGALLLLAGLLAIMREVKPHLTVHFVGSGVHAVLDVDPEPRPRP